MSKKQLLLYSLALMLIFGNGSGLATMIPVHLSHLGIQPDQIGFLFAMLYVGIGSSGILAGWLVDRFGQRRRLAVITAAGEIAAALMLLWARSYPALAVAFFISWFLAGAHAAVVSALVGLQAANTERGRVFGVIGFMTGLGQVLTGFMYGKIVDAHGFETLLVLNVGISIAWTILTLLYKEPASPTLEQKHANLQNKPNLPASFWLVVLAAILGWVAINGGKLGITLVMSGLDFSAGDISLTVGVASLAALAMPLLLGWLSDRTGRKPILLALNLLGLAGLFLIGSDTGLASFCAASALLSLYSCFSGLSNALATDLLPPGMLGFGLALVNSTSYIAGMFSSVLVGVAIKGMGNQAPFLAAMILPLLAAVLLAVITERKQTTLQVVLPEFTENNPGQG
jgi:MFS family permease